MTIPKLEQNTSKTITDSKNEFIEEKDLQEHKEKYALIWQECLTILEKKIKKITFNTWINKLQLIGINEDIIRLETKNEFTKNFIEQSYIKTIQEALKEVTAKSFAIKIEVAQINEDLVEIEEAPVSITEQKTIASVTQNNIPSENKTKLNSKISLEKTYFGDFNRTCFAFSKTILEDCSNVYKSLFIFSYSGLGKSHFLNLIGNETLKEKPSAKVKYISSESFTNELIMSIQKNRTQAFRDKYRDLDLLLFDDFQFLENKKTCQEEFIHTYESITKKGGKVIISSNKNLAELKNVNPKLISILKSSLVSTIDEPQEEDKNRLIDFKIKELKINLKENHRNMIYKLDGDCIRELEGNLLQVSALQKFSGLDVDTAAIEKVVECSFSPTSRGLSIQAIIKVVADYFYINIEDLTGKRRKEEFTKARHIAIYLSHKLLALSYKKIGSFFSDRKHSSIIHSINTVESLLETNLPSSKFTHQAISEIKAKLDQ
jgi:chromosomal replication initiator protein